MPKDPKKPLIHLSLGDPTIFGSLGPPPGAAEEVAKNTLSRKHDGYVPSVGTDRAREVIAERYSIGDTKVSKDDVWITGGGGSGPLDYAINVVLDAGTNILLPCPGFDKFQTICDNRSIEYKYYDLLPEKQWDVDLEHLESLIDAKTRAILINSPSNPCGAVYSKEHLQELIGIAEKHHLPIISDEIYEDVVHKGVEFHPVRTLTDSVPVITTGGLSKRYAAPGWRFAWLLLHDPQNRAPEFRTGLNKLATIQFGGSTIIQASLEQILLKTDQSWYQAMNDKLEKHANYIYERMLAIPELHPIQSRGAMYLLVEILYDLLDIDNDVEFTQKLLDEEYVCVMPGSCFQAPDYMRIVVCAPLEWHEEACNRIEAFCKRHRKWKPAA